MTRTQSWLIFAAGIIAAVVFLALTYYFGADAAGHPRGKHMILFIVLCLLSLLVSWYAYPKSATQ